MTNEQYPALGCYVSKELHSKFRYLAATKDTSMSKLLMALIMVATKDLNYDPTTGKVTQVEKTNSPT